MAGAHPEERVAFPLVRQGWRQVALLHWRYDAGEIRRLLPAGLEPDIVDGSAWVSLTPFRVERFRVLGAPPLPVVSSFPETNLRTYVRSPAGRDGLWFLSLDVPSLSNAAAGRVLGARYFLSSMSVRDGDTVRYRCRRLIGPRAHHDITVRPGGTVDPRHRDTADLLAGRWRAFNRLGPGLVEVPVTHEPWALRAAEIVDLDESLLATAGLRRPGEDPLVHFADGVDARLGPPRRPRPTPA